MGVRKNASKALRLFAILLITRAQQLLRLLHNVAQVEFLLSSESLSL